jgi:protocatechuate 3,4-dioxygenase beta subunit
MKTLQWWTIMLGLAGNLATGAGIDGAETISLTGKVVNADGQAVGGAAIECYEHGPGVAYSPDGMEGRQQVTADSKGGFELRLPRTVVTLVARKAGLAPAWKQFTAAPNLEPRLVLVSPGILAGVVVDEADKPVAGAEVVVARAFSETEDDGRRSYNYLDGRMARDVFSARTGADGRFRLDAFPTNASADLAVRLPGKALRQAPRESFGADSMQCRAGDKDLRLVLEPAGSVEGKIITENTAQALPTARLWLQSDQRGIVGSFDNESAQSGADGAFRINDVPAGSYRLWAVFGTNVTPEWVAETVPVSVEMGKPTSGVQVTARRGGLLQVSVLERNDRKGVDRVSLTVYRESFQTTATSRSNGLALLRLVPGDYQVSANKEGWRSGNATATVEAGQTNRLEIELAAPPKIKGVVRRPDGQPAAGLPIRIVGGYSAEEARNKTDANGAFEVEWDPRRYGRPDMTYCLLIRDPERNLAVAQDIEEESGPLELKLAPGLTLVGRAECDGKPVTNATAALVFWAGNSGMHLTGLCTGTNVPGHFEVSALPPGRKYGLYVSAPGYGQKYVNAVETDANTKLVDLDPAELRPAKMKLAGKVLDADDKPVAGIYVSLYGEGQPNANVRTDREGCFSFNRVCEGQARLSANARNSYGSVTAEAGDTNVVLKLGESSGSVSSASSKPHKLTGTVTDPDGKPVGGALVAVFPSGSTRGIKTGTNGTFNLTWHLESWQMQNGNPLLVVRDLARHFAVAEEMSEEITNLNLQLKPAVTLTGRVEGPDGKPLTNAQVGVWLLASRTYSDVEERQAKTDARGVFQVPALPASLDYTVYATAKDHGRSQQRVQVETETNRLELEPFVLKVADQVLAGQVVNRNDKPVAGASISVSGEDQPQASVTTDSKGRFKLQVCEGQVRLFANAEGGYASATFEAGDTNVVLQLGRNESVSRQTPQRSSLKGKSLPDLAALGFAADAAPAGKRVLLCLMDVEQRPSRRLVRLLSEQYNALKEKGLAVLAVQAALTTPESLKEWKAANPVPFPVGSVPDKSEKTKWASGVESLPWIILTDAQGRVAAEGFGFDELEAKLEASTR